jgi:TetR/AcrR family transcriptional regulator, transcriptional repressor of bet genes
VSTASTAERARPGRPSSGARERILEGCLEVLKADGYAGLTTAKVAAASGESKALIAYHFGSKHGLVAAAGDELGQTITARILEGIGEARTVEGIVRGAFDGAWAILEHDARLPRVYFDLNAVSVVEPEIRDVMREVKAGFRRVFVGLLRGAEESVDARTASTVAVLVIAGIEGLSLERIERGETAELGRARELFIRSVLACLR